MTDAMLTETHQDPPPNFLLSPELAELVEKGYVYIAQAPRQSKRGKKEEYIKDEGTMIRYLMRMAKRT